MLQPLRAAGMVLLLLSFTFVANASEPLKEIVLRSSDLPKGWGFARGNYAVSAVASDFYSNYSATYADRTGATLVDKEFQSIQGGPERANIFYLLFANDDDAARAMVFAQSVVWEGSRPTAEHPERIFTLESALVIVSSASSEVADRLEKSVRARSRKD